MGKPFFVIHDHYRIPFSPAVKLLTDPVLNELCGILVNDKPLSLMERICRSKPSVDGLDWFSLANKVRVIGRSSITDRRAVVSPKSVNNFRKYVDRALNDFRTHLIYDRDRLGATNSYSRSVHLINACLNSEGILRDLKPSAIIFTDEPHDFPNWIFKIVAEVLGYPIYILKARTNVDLVEIDSVNVQAPEIFVRLRVESDSENNAKAVSEETIERLRTGPYSEVEPAYMKKQGQGWSLASWSWWREFRLCFPKDPSKWKSAMNASRAKRKAFATYQDLSIEEVKWRKSKYGVFFLHYQPELSTVPRGNLFGQQLVAIYEIAASLPKDVRLLVKEHPSMYFRPFNVSVRSGGFYENIASISNVDLVPLQEDSFSLIDGANFVATITGTAGFEGYCRGKQVIIFGSTFFDHLSGVHRADVLGSEAAVSRCLDADMDCSSRVDNNAPDRGVDAILCECWQSNVGLSSTADLKLQVLMGLIKRHDDPSMLRLAIGSTE